MRYFSHAISAAFMLSCQTTIMKTNTTIKGEEETSIALTSDTRDDDTSTLSSVLSQDIADVTMTMPDGTVIPIKDFASDWFAAMQNYKSLIHSVFQKRGVRADLKFVDEKTTEYKKEFWTSKVSLPGLESYGEFDSAANAPGYYFMRDDKAFYGQIKEAQNAALKAAFEAITDKFKEMGVVPEWA